MFAEKHSGIALRIIHLGVLVFQADEIRGISLGG
jgi:hypothetical protein